MIRFMNVSSASRLGLCVAGLLLVAAPAAPEILEQILVKVNGEILTKTDLEQRQIIALRSRNIPVGDPDSEELKKLLEEVTPRIIVDAVDEMLLMQRARELGYRLADEQFTTIIENIKKENKIESDEDFQTALKGEGMTMADLRKVIEKQMVISRVQQAEVVAKISVSDEEHQTYYAAHPEEFTTPSEVTLREILIEVPGDGSGVNVGLDEEARDEATRLRERVMAGESFERLAADYSDAPSKANGGLIGPIKREEIAPNLREMLAGMKIGEISEVLRTRTGYQILKLESATEAQAVPLEQVKDQVADKVYEQKRRAEVTKYITKLRSQALIEWKNEEIRKVYEQALATVQAGALLP